jgi:cell division protein ZapA (FtsZ GTPase activity inhibitor)
MSSIDQVADSIIAEEGINNATPAVDTTPPETPKEPETPEPVTPPETPPVEPPKPEIPAEEPKEPAIETPVDTPVPTPPTPAETDEKLQSFIGSLNLSEDKIFDAQGNALPFNEVVPVGQFLSSQLQPIKVTDKDGKQHEFTLLSEVKEAFPDGFQAKNNIEQMEFQSAIMANEAKFKSAIDTYKSAETRYTQETNAIVQARSDNERIGKEYKAMADAGLVPKVEGNPDDPKFLEQAAIKELDKILNYMETKNKELKEKGLGSITSVYIAKQMMDNETKVEDKDKKKEDIINQRQEVASLSANPSSDTDKPKQTLNDVPMSRLAEEIIASEGLK